MTNGENSSVQIAGDAVDPTSKSILPSTQGLLRGLSLLPNDDDLKKAGSARAAFTGPPDSVTVIEAGATAASKWWATAIGGGATVVTARISAIWDDFDDWTQAFAVLSVGLVLGAAALGIAYLLASDVRGRAAATVATIEARRDVAIEMARQGGAASLRKAVGPRAESANAVTHHSAWTGIGPLDVANVRKQGPAEQNWTAIATRQGKDGVEYLLVKATESAWVPASEVSFS